MVSRQREWQLAKIAQGFCSQCGIGKLYRTDVCLLCYERRKKRCREFMRRKLGIRPHAQDYKFRMQLESWHKFMNKVIDAYKAGASLNQTGEMHGIGPDTVRRILILKEIMRRKPGPVPIKND